jgi:hypothetical protein
MGLQLRLGHGEPGPPRRRPRRLRSGVAREPHDRAPRLDPGHDVDVRGLQHGGLAGGDSRDPRRLPRRRPRRRSGRRPPHRPRPGPAPPPDPGQPRDPRFHRKDEAVRPGLGHDARRSDVGHGDSRHLRRQAGVRVEDPRPRLSVRGGRALVRDHLRLSYVFTRLLQRREALEF